MAVIRADKIFLFNEKLDIDFEAGADLELQERYLASSAG